MSDTSYFLERAQQEAILAIQAVHPAAAYAHQSLSSRYSAQAILAIVDEQDTGREKARHHALIETLVHLDNPELNSP